MSAHSIVRVEARALRVEVDFAWIGVKRTRVNPMCYVEVETSGGVVGHGLTHLSQGSVAAHIVNDIAGPALIGSDALANEKIWQMLYWMLTSSGQSGFACNAISAIDLALWDIKGKVAGMPVWKLLGGARDRLDVYCTLGVQNLERDQLLAMAKRVVDMGFRTIKMQVGRPGLDRRQSQKSLADIVDDDVSRVTALRETVGGDIKIAIDAACRLDLMHAADLARRVEPLGIAFFEEPVTQNDVLLMADLRRQTSIPLTAGQGEGQAHRFRDMLLHKAIDVVQPNVLVAGGYTQSVRIANMAATFNVPISNGGGCPYHNMHLQAGAMNGTMLEYQLNSARACEMLFDGWPETKQGLLNLPDTPGLGFEPKPGVIAELTAFA